MARCRWFFYAVEIHTAATGAHVYSEVLRAYYTLTRSIFASQDSEYVTLIELNLCVNCYSHMTLFCYVNRDSVEWKTDLHDLEDCVRILGRQVDTSESEVLGKKKSSSVKIKSAQWTFLKYLATFDFSLLCLHNKRNSLGLVRMEDVNSLFCGNICYRSS